MPIGVTDLATLKPVFVTAIHARTPSQTRSQVRGWQHVPGDRPAPPGHGMRRFRLTFDPSNFVENGLYGEDVAGVGVHEVESILHVLVDYGGVPMEHVDEIVDDDQYDLAATLEDLASPTTTGLVAVESLGDPFDQAEENEGDQSQYDYRFMVRYMKLRP